MNSEGQIQLDILDNWSPIGYRDHFQSIAVDQIPSEGLQSKRRAGPHYLQPVL